MKCFTCKTQMVNYDDIVYIGLRVDFKKCPRCNSTAEITYGENGEYITKVIWKRERIKD